MEREGREDPARGVALDLFPGWSRTTGHPVPLREGGELAPLSHTGPVIHPSQIQRGKGKRDSEEQVPAVSQGPPLSSKAQVPG